MAVRNSVVLISVLLLCSGCDRQSEVTNDEAATMAAQARTMKEANDDVDAAMAEAGNADAVTKDTVLSNMGNASAP